MRKHELNYPTHDLELAAVVHALKLKEIAENIVIGKAPGFHMDDNRTLWFGKRLCVPTDKAI